MSTTKFIGASAAVLVLLAVGTAVHQVRGERDAVEGLAVERQAQAELAARVRAIEQQAEAARQDAARVQGELEAARAAAAARPMGGKGVMAGATMVTDAQDPVAVGKELLARFPALKQALLDRSFARIRARFESLYLELQLTPEQVEKFEAILLNGEGITSSAPGGGMFQLQPGDGRSPAEMEQALQELLGAEGYRKFRATNERASGQQFATALASALYFTDEPLTAQQARQLGSVVSQYPMRAAADNLVTRDWDALLAAARPWLSDGQLAALTRIRVQEEFGVNMKRRMFSGKP